MLFHGSIDVDLPTEIDDEYWPTSASDGPPRQPEGKPSKVAVFVALIRLTRILASALRTIVSSVFSEMPAWSEHSFPHVVVPHQEIQTAARPGPAMGAAHRHRSRFFPEQLA